MIKDTLHDNAQTVLLSLGLENKAIKMAIISINMDSTNAVSFKNKLLSLRCTYLMCSSIRSYFWQIIKYGMRTLLCFAVLTSFSPATFLSFCVVFWCHTFYTAVEKKSELGQLYKQLSHAFDPCLFDPGVFSTEFCIVLPDIKTLYKSFMREDIQLIIILYTWIL